MSSRPTLSESRTALLVGSPPLVRNEVLMRSGGEMNMGIR